DSWVGALSPADYAEFVAPHSARILAAVDVPTIHFGTGTATLLPDMAAAGGDVIGLDWRIPLDEGWERAGDDVGVQGNLDLEAMQAADWVAEQPEVHLLPHLREACASLPLDIVDARTAADGVFEVELRWRGEGAGIGEIRSTVFALAGSIAEVATYVRQREG